MRTTIDIPDHIMKQAKFKAVEEGISLKELFIKALSKELYQPEGEDPSSGGKAPWEKLRGMGSASGLAASDTGFEGYSGPDWNHGVQINDPKE